MLRRIFALIAVATIAVANFSTVAATAPDPFAHLNPGGKTPLRELVPVNIVFVGYEPGQVDAEALLGGLPGRYRPQVRSLLFYGIDGDLGIDYRFDYDVTYADVSYEDAFFARLRGLSRRAPLTLFQQDYNAQETNVLDVTSNHLIDAPSVERWLVNNPPSGVDTHRNTVFFLNWWGRDDFEFHVYTKTNEPDPDTGYNFGVQRESRRIIAWGGTPPDDEENALGGGDARRVWFYDLSAGPESWTDNWNVDDPDLDGDGETDYRMPPIWEYLTPGGNRGPGKLTADLAMITRYVAIDLLFTTSPLYPPALTPPRMPSSVNLDLNTYEAWPGVNASRRYVDERLVREEEAELLRIPTSLDQQDLALRGQAARCFDRWVREVKCYPVRGNQYPDPFANLFLYHAFHRERFTDGGGQYEATVFHFANDFPAGGGLLGYSDDNWLDGTQSSVFAFVNPLVVELGYGLSTTDIHEVGHHAGMSHPHDGYDFERGLDFGPGGPFYFAWSGDESNTIMSYIDLNWDFSQFDRDNHWRTTAAAYLINANAIAEDILASPGADQGMEQLGKADVEAGLAKASFDDHDYGAAFDHARRAFNFVKAAASDAGVRVPVGTRGWFVLPPVLDEVAGGDVAGYAFIDRIGPRSHRVRD
jgi:hypothetical protein